MEKENRIEIKGADVVWLLDVKAWRTIAIGLILFCATGLLGSIPFAWQWTQAKAEKIDNVELATEVLTVQQTEDREQRKILNGVVVELKTISAATVQSVSNIEREMKFNRCMDEKQNADKCVSILLIQ